MQQELLNLSNSSNEKYKELNNRNIEMRKCIKQLERDETRRTIVKNMNCLSRRKQKRRIQTLGNRGQKALRFLKQFGLEIASLQFTDRRHHSVHCLC